MNSVNPPVSFGQRISKELPQLEVIRSTNFQLPAQARVLVVVQAESRGRLEQSLIDVCRKWFSSRYAAVTVAPDPLLADEANALAIRQDADFLLTARVVQWPIDGDKDPHCALKPADACPSVVSPDQLGISLRIDDLGAGRVIDTLSLRRSDGLYADDADRLEIAAEALEKMFGSLLP